MLVVPLAGHKGEMQRTPTESLTQMLLLAAQSVLAQVASMTLLPSQWAVQLLAVVNSLRRRATKSVLAVRKLYVQPYAQPLHSHAHMLPHGSPFS